MLTELKMVVVFILKTFFICLQKFSLLIIMTSSFDNKYLKTINLIDDPCKFLGLKLDQTIIFCLI